MIEYKGHILNDLLPTATERDNVVKHPGVEKLL